MSDLDYDAHLTDDEREAICICPWDATGVHEGDSHTTRCSQHRAAVERILSARLLDLAQRAEADRAAVERVTALADQWERRGSILPANQLGKPHAPAMKQAVDRLRAALDPKEDQ
jgi:hypothetical protein